VLDLVQMLVIEKKNIEKICPMNVMKQISAAFQDFFEGKKFLNYHLQLQSSDSDYIQVKKKGL
jgi:hypothetical protein